MEELLTRYGKVDYAWFDGFNWPGGGLDFKHDEAKALLLKHQPDILLNPRYNNWGEGPKFGDLGTAENHFPNQRPAGPWEFCWCMRGGWFAGGKGKTPQRHARGHRPGQPGEMPLLGWLHAARHRALPRWHHARLLLWTLRRDGAWMDKNKESLLGVKGGPWPERVNVPVTTKNGKTWYLSPGRRMTRANS